MRGTWPFSWQRARAFLEALPRREAELRLAARVTVAALLALSLAKLLGFQ